MCKRGCKPNYYISIGMLLSTATYFLYDAHWKMCIRDSSHTSGYLNSYADLHPVYLDGYYYKLNSLKLD